MPVAQRLKPKEKIRLLLFANMYAHTGVCLRIFSSHRCVAGVHLFLLLLSLSLRTRVFPQNPDSSHVFSSFLLLDACSIGSCKRVVCPHPTLGLRRDPACRERVLRYWPAVAKDFPSFLEPQFRNVECRVHREVGGRCDALS
jgi:hypothetical protein